MKKSHNQTKKKEYELCPLSRQDVNQAVQIMMKSYDVNNLLQKSGFRSWDKFKEASREMIILHLDMQDKFTKEINTDDHYNYTFKHNGKIVGVFLNMEFQQYLSLHIDKGTIFQPLEDKIDPTIQKRGTALFGSRFTIRQQYLDKGVGLRFAYEMIKWTSIRNAKWVEYCYFIASNPLTAFMTTPLGCEAIESIDYERKGKNYPIYLMRVPFKVALQQFDKYRPKKPKPGL